MDFFTGMLKEIPTFNLVLNVGLFWLAVRIYAQTLKTNGRLTKLESWQEGHEKQDDERHRELRDGQRDIWNAVNNSPPHP